MSDGTDLTFTPKVFYNRVRRHKHLDQISPREFERQRQTAL